MRVMSVALEPMEQDDLVDPIDEFRPEAAAHDLHHLIAHGVGILPLGLVHQEFGAEV